jgi:hypothetical protein
MSAPSQAEHKPSELDALLLAIADGIDALVAWDIAAFQSAAQRQSELCTRIASRSVSPRSAADITAAIQVRKLTRIYARLLQHSIHWTHTLRTILQDSGHISPCHGSVHFRG